MTAILGTLLASIFSGGATGLFGVLVQRFFDMKSKAQDIELIAIQHKNALELAGQEWSGKLELSKMTTEGQVRVAVAEGEAKIEEAATMALAASYAADKGTYLTEAVIKAKSLWVTLPMTFVDFVRGMTRPALTIYLVVVTHYMYADTVKLMVDNSGLLTSDNLHELATKTVATLAYLSTTSVIWWFGTRPPKCARDK